MRSVESVLGTIFPRRSNSAAPHGVLAGMGHQRILRRLIYLGFSGDRVIPSMRRPNKPTTEGDHAGQSSEWLTMSLTEGKTH
jgi:hypothetical protein